MRKKILVVMLALCMVVTMIPVFALAEEDLDVVIGNNGYPYGQEMGTEQITLLIDAVNATSYQWQEANTADSDGWTNLDVNESKKSKVTFTPENNKWYRCVVNGIESYPVQALKVGSTGNDCYEFTKAIDGQWYIGNGAMAYFTSSVKEFDIVGKYIVPDGSYAGIYWANTSFNKYWSVGSHKDPSESMSSYENTNLEKLTLYFDPQNDRSVFVDMKLGENYNAAAFGTDTMLGNDNSSGSAHPFYYDDSASLKAVFENGIFKQVQMVGALSLEEADEEDIAFVVTPITSNAIFWIGAYSQQTKKGEAYNYNLGNSSYNEYYTFGTGIQSDFDSYVTEIQNRDSALAISWKNLTPNSTVSFAFSIGTVAQTGATVSGSVIGSATDIVTLNVSEDLTDVNQIVIKRGEEILEQGEDKDYTVDLSDPDNPKIKFNEFAGLNVSSGDLTVTITFSGGNTSSAIITNEIPGTGNVSDELGTIEGIESEGLGNIAKEEEKDIVLIVKEEVAVEEDAEQEAIKAKAGDKTIEFLDITLKDRNISNPLEALIESVSKPLEIAIPFNADGKYNITVYRYHNEKAKAFTKLDEKPAENARVDGTFYIDNVNNKIYIYTSKFSIYAIGYTDYPTYTVNFDLNYVGGVDPSPLTTGVGGKLSGLPDADRDGYTFKGWYTAAEGGEEVTTDTVFNADATVYAQWQENSAGEPPVSKKHKCESVCGICGGCLDEDCGKAACVDKCTAFSIDFDDVTAIDWYSGAVNYVCHRGIMEGIGDGLFDPAGTTTRAMIVTTLWRLEGEPAFGQGKSGTFADVEEDVWYTEAVEWAAANEIVEGYGDGNFGPMDSITREQLAAILYRYAQYKGYDVSVGEDTNILSFEDAFSISEYAFPALQWVCVEGIMEGKGEGMLEPLSPALRGEIAQILMNFLE